MHTYPQTTSGCQDLCSMQPSGTATLTSQPQARLLALLKAVPFHLQEREQLLQGISLLSCIYNGNKLAGFKIMPSEFYNAAVCEHVALREEYMVWRRTKVGTMISSFFLTSMVPTAVAISLHVGLHCSSYRAPTARTGSCVRGATCGVPCLT